MTTKKKIWAYLTSLGMTAAGAAGMMGNLYAESGLKPKNLQNSYEKPLGYTDSTYTEAVDSGEYTDFAKDCAGYGLAQWTHHTRKAALLTYAQNCGTSIGDPDMQLRFLGSELMTSYPKVLEVLRTTDDVRTASDAVMLDFERPADTSEDARTKRAEYAERFYKEFAAESQQDKPASTESTAGKSVETLAEEVLAGAWGNGKERKDRLTAAGYDYAAVQQRVNQICRPLHHVSSGDTLTKIASKYGVTVEEIVTKNRKQYPSITADYIEAGWTLRV
ncbi:MAG: LysM peptidoglycan-binding domain-containing protein [Ruminococcus sp.]|nr:LysM peptidoglycan-binding domain-containing protein [Ruminococcus sp.]